MSTSRIDKLPVWAQEELRNRGRRILELEGQLQELRAQLKNEHPESNTYLGTDAGDLVPLGVGPDIEFRQKPGLLEGDGSGFVVNVTDAGDLHVFAHGNLMLCPEDADTVVIKISKGN